MYISYGLGLAVVAVIATMFWVVTAVVLFLPLAPAITLLSRVLWIYLDQTVDPERISR
jgi:hypothetical protein